MARPGPQKRQITDAEDIIRVWATRVRSGATTASRVHGVSRKCVYDLCDRVEADTELKVRAEKHLKDVRAELDAREQQVHQAELDTRHALVTQLRLRSAKMSPAQITNALGVLAPREADGKSGGNVVIQIPPPLAAPRSDGSA